MYVSSSLGRLAGLLGSYFLCPGAGEAINERCVVLLNSFTALELGPYSSALQRHFPIGTKSIPIWNAYSDCRRDVYRMFHKLSEDLNRKYSGYTTIVETNDFFDAHVNQLREFLATSTIEKPPQFLYVFIYEPLPVLLKRCKTCKAFFNTLVEFTFVFRGETLMPDSNVCCAGFLQKTVLIGLIDSAALRFPEMDSNDMNVMCTLVKRFMIPLLDLQFNENGVWLVSRLNQFDLVVTASTPRKAADAIAARLRAGGELKKISVRKEESESPLVLPICDNCLAALDMFGGSTDPNSRIRASLPLCGVCLDVAKEQLLRGSTFGLKPNLEIKSVTQSGNRIAETPKQTKPDLLTYYNPQTSIQEVTPKYVPETRHSAPNERLTQETLGSSSATKSERGRAINESTVTESIRAIQPTETDKEKKRSKSTSDGKDRHNAKGNERKDSEVLGKDWKEVEDKKKGGKKDKKSSRREAKEKRKAEDERLKAEAAEAAIRAAQEAWGNTTRIEPRLPSDHEGSTAAETLSRRSERAEEVRHRRASATTSDEEAAASKTVKARKRKGHYQSSTSSSLTTSGSSESSKKRDKKRKEKEKALKDKKKSNDTTTKRSLKNDERGKVKSDIKTDPQSSVQAQSDGAVIGGTDNDESALVPSGSASPPPPSLGRSTGRDASEAKGAKDKMSAKEKKRNRSSTSTSSSSASSSSTASSTTSSSGAKKKEKKKTDREQKNTPTNKKEDKETVVKAKGRKEGQAKNAKGSDFGSRSEDAGTSKRTVRREKDRDKNDEEDTAENVGEEQGRQGKREQNRDHDRNRRSSRGKKKQAVQDSDGPADSQGKDEVQRDDKHRDRKKRPKDERARSSESEERAGHRNGKRNRNEAESSGRRGKREEDEERTRGKEKRSSPPGRRNGWEGEGSSKGLEDEKEGGKPENKRKERTTGRRERGGSDARGDKRRRRQRGSDSSSRAHKRDVGRRDARKPSTEGGAKPRKSKARDASISTGSSRKRGRKEGSDQQELAAAGRSTAEARGEQTVQEGRRGSENRKECEQIVTCDPEVGEENAWDDKYEEEVKEVHGRRGGKGGKRKRRHSSSDSESSSSSSSHARRGKRRGSARERPKGRAAREHAPSDEHAWETEEVISEANSGKPQKALRGNRRTSANKGKRRTKR